MKVTFQVIKKNQILVIAVLLMLVVAGYLNYQYDPNSVYDVELTGKIEENLGDAVLVNSYDLEIPPEIVEVSAEEEYFIQTKIDQTNAYAQQIEIYEKMLENSQLSVEQQNKAQEEISHINAERDAIMIAENLIRLKGHEQVVVLVNGNSINVVIAANDLKSQQVAQIQNIIMHEFQTQTENIHITVR